MSLKGYRKCVCCDRFINFNDDMIYYIGLGEYEGKWICEMCSSDDIAEKIATVVFYKNGVKKYTMVVGVYSVWVNDVDGDVIYNSLGYDDMLSYDRNSVSLLKSYAKSIKWFSSGYRGHYEGNINDEMIRVIDSWFCGSDGHNIVDDLDKIHKNLEVEGLYPDFLMLMAFTRTSNVFSTGVEVYIKKQDEEAYNKWLGVLNE